MKQGVTKTENSKPIVYRSKTVIGGLVGSWLLLEVYND